MALEYVYWVRETCPDVSIFWVHASNAHRMRQSFTSIAVDCKIPGHGDPEIDVFSIVHNWLMRKDNGPWVMILDNADDAELFFPTTGGGDNLGQYIPECAHGSVIVTTRNKQAGLKLAKGKPPIEIGTMDDEESQQLLRANLGDWASDSNSDDLWKLSSRLEHLPLALAQAAAFIEANTMPVYEYLKILNESDQTLVDLLSEDFETIGRDSWAPRAVTETWILSFEQIKKQSPLAAELLSLLSFFDRQAIPVEFLISESSNEMSESEKEALVRIIIASYQPWIPKGFVGHDTYPDKTPKGWSWREARIQKALGILKAFSFITADKDLSLNVHRLVQLVTRKWLEKEGQMANFARQALFVVAETCPHNNFKNRTTLAKHIPHIYSVLKLQRSMSRADRLCAGILCHKNGEFLFDRGQWKEAEGFLLDAVGTTQDLLGPEAEATLAAQNSLSNVYYQQSRLKEAEKLQLHVVDAAKRVYGEEHSFTLACLGSLALTYSAQVRWEEAEALYLRCIDVHSRILGEEHPNTLSCMGNLSLTYQKQRRWEEAQKLGERVMEVEQRLFGEDHPNTLISMGNLAQFYWEQGRRVDAMYLQRECLRRMEATLGLEHPHTLEIRSIFAKWLEAMRIDG